MLSFFPYILAFLIPLSTINAGFPNGRCYVNSCSSSPFDIHVTQATRGRLCFVVKDKPCVETSTRYSCCKLFENNLNKIVISAQRQCNSSIEQVSINGERKGGGVFFDDYDTFAELRVTSLRMNKTSVRDKEFCIHLKEPCDLPSTFCSLDGSCKTAIFDAAGHTCCPTCEMHLGETVQMASSPPRVSPPRPPPRPRSPPRMQLSPPSPMRRSDPPSPPLVKNPPLPMLIMNKACNCNCDCQCES